MKDRTQARLAALDADAQQRMDELRHANRRDLNAILISLVIIFVVLSLVGIVVTHKVVGPIYRMRMLVGRIDGDHLVLHGKLRHGDELQDLFEEVSAMLDRLRDHQQAEIGALEGLLKRLREAEGDAERMKVVAELEAFRARMAHALAPKPVDG
jgi:signal transduction histidine kinase